MIGPSHGLQRAVLAETMGGGPRGISSPDCWAYVLLCKKIRSDSVLSSGGHDVSPHFSPVHSLIGYIYVVCRGSTVAY